MLFEKHVETNEEVVIVNLMVEITKDYIIVIFHIVELFVIFIKIYFFDNYIEIIDKIDMYKKVLISED